MSLSNSSPSPATGQTLSFRLVSYLGWAAAVCFAGIALWLGQLYFTTRTENDLLRQEQALSAVALRTSQNQLEAERILARRELQDASQRDSGPDRGSTRSNDLAQLRIATLTSPPGDSSQATAIAVWDPVKQEGLLGVEKLPALPADQEYRIWLVDPQYQNPVTGGVFRVDPNTGKAQFTFTAAKPVRTVTKFIVSMEVTGSSPKVAGPMVLLGH